MHKHHILPKEAPYLEELHEFRLEEEWQVYLTVEGHACQHDVLYRAFRWGGDKIANESLLGIVGKEEVVKEVCRLGGKTRALSFTPEYQRWVGSHQPAEVRRKNLKTWLDQRTEEQIKQQNAKGSRAMINRNKKPVKVTKISDGSVYFFDSVKEAAKTLNLNKSHLAEIARKSSGRRTCKGYTVEYVNEVDN